MRDIQNRPAARGDAIEHMSSVTSLTPPSGHASYAPDDTNGRRVAESADIPSFGVLERTTKQIAKAASRCGGAMVAFFASLYRLATSYRTLNSKSDQSRDPGHGADFQMGIDAGFSLQLKTGIKVLITSIGVIGVWTIAAPLSAAIVVAGTLVAAGSVKKIQHPNGGVAAQIFARDGMNVREGDMLVRLDETQARTNLTVLSKQLDEVRSRIARLAAERDGADEMTTPPDIDSQPTTNRDIEQLLIAERSLFAARANARRGQKDLLGRQIGQLNEQISGVNAQAKSKESQLELISSELQGIKSLYEKQLVPLTRLTALQRESARLEGERGQLHSLIAETQSKISAAELQIVRIDQDFRTEVLKELREAQEKQAELSERVVAAKDLFNRIDIRAPTSGVVHQLSVHTIGGVIGPGEVIMEIVPDSEELQIEGKLQPRDIDQARVGQKAIVRFPAFNQVTTPELDGVVSFVSADLSHDRQTNSPYYTIRVVLSRVQRERLGSLQLLSGMPSELFLEAGSRTMMSYLLKPIIDQTRRSFNQR